jgi:hypothetical protein
MFGFVNDFFELELEVDMFLIFLEPGLLFDGFLKAKKINFGNYLTLDDSCFE